MAQWAREEALGTYPSHETLHKIAANLHAAADALASDEEQPASRDEQARS
jgi:transcriptional regulator with XRE-family HTH domain